jgi:hypothetical protein
MAGYTDNLLSMAQHNIDAILGWWILEGQVSKKLLLEAFEQYLRISQPNFELN